MSRFHFALLALLSTGCSSPASNPSHEPASADETGTPAEDIAPPCTSSISEPLIAYDTTFFSGSALVLNDQWAGIGWIDAADVPMVSYAARSDLTVTHVRASKYALSAAKYGARPLDMIFAHGRFGITWGSERSNGWQAALFSTVDPATGTASPSYYASNELDRTGSGGKGSNVSARHPMITPLQSGFLVAWEDRRTKEPTTTGVNLFGWAGIYAFAFDASGKPTRSEDVQVAQPTGLLQSGHSFSGGPTKSGHLAVWLAYGDSRTTFHARLGPASGDFTTYSPGPPLADFAGLQVQSMALAQGADGKHVAAFSAGPLNEPDQVVVRLLAEDGKPIGTSTLLRSTAGRRVSPPAIVAHGDGYAAVYAELAPAKDRGDDTLASVHVFLLDATGAIVSEKNEELTLENATIEGTPQLSIREAGGTQVWLATRAARNDRFASPKTKHVETRLLTVCR